MSGQPRTLEGWQVAALPAGLPDQQLPETSSLRFLEAEVPGAVQYDLLRAGELGNFFAGTEAARAAGWVAETDWCYRTSFRLAEAPPGLSLDVPGVDTFSELWLNGRLVGETGSNYRPYRFALGGAAKTGDNELLIRVKAHRRMVAGQLPEARSRLATASNRASFGGKSLIRRYQRSFLSGSSSLLNLGAEILGIGINRPVSLVAVPGDRIDRFHFQVESVSDRLAGARLTVEVSAAEPVSLRLEASLVEPGGAVAASAGAPVEGGRAELALEVADPRLWWPRGYGAAERYRLELRLAGPGGTVARCERLVGLRRVELLERLPSGRATFQLVVNGVPVHVRGHNLVPLDYVKVHRSPDEYRHTLRLVEASNANLVRIWGGGMEEAGSFYDALDEAGILLWQDFFLHSATYPDYDPAYVEAFREESRGVVRRLRNHPCLALLCGGNEQDEGWDEWGWQGDLDRFYGSELAHVVGAEVAAAEAPEVPFVPNSPHGAGRSQSPGDGDMHCWGNFYNATKDPVFVTETCWNLQSYSAPETLAETMGLDVDDYAELGWPERWRALTGLPLVTKLPYSGWNASRTLRAYLDGLAVEHLLADHHALAMLRLRSPSCRGIVYWPLNKGAPLFEFGCVDYAGRPLMNYYAVKRLFADVAVTAYRELDGVAVVASNLSRAEVTGSLRLVHADAAGTVLLEQSVPVRLPADSQAKLLEVEGLYGRVGDRTRELVAVRLEAGDGALLAHDALFFCPLAEFDELPAELAAVVGRAGEGTWRLELAAAAVVRLVRLEGDGLLFSDNCFTLLPGERRALQVEVLDGGTGAGRAVTVAAFGSGAGERLELP